MTGSRLDPANLHIVRDTSLGMKRRELVAGEPKDLRSDMMRTSLVLCHLFLLMMLLHKTSPMK